MSKVTSEGPFRGNRTPEHLKDGPVQGRGCTDPICLIIFAVLWAGFIAVAVYGFKNGEPLALVAPYDQFGNPCGLDAQKDFPYLYFQKKGANVSSTATVCIATCPSNTTTSLSCAPDFPASNCSTLSIYGTTTFANRICLPQSQDQANALAQADALALNPLFKAASDLEAAWWLICAVGVIAVCVGFIYMLFMRYCSGAVTWGLLVMYELGLIVFGVICILESSQNSFSKTIGPTALSSISPTILIVIAILCFLVALVSLIVMCFMMDRIKLGIQVLQAASNFVEDVKTVLFVPPIFFILSLLFYVFWIFTFIYLVGTNTVNESAGGLPFAHVEWNSKAAWLFAYLIIVLIWNHTFFHALPQFVISSVACMWYFRKAKALHHPVSTSMFRAVLHLGSIAFGALMVGIVDFLKLIFKLFRKVLVPNTNEQSGCCARCCGFITGGCLACFEACLQFIDRHAYVQMAMTGKNFCTSTKQAFYLILRNSLRFGTIHGLGAIFVYFGEIFITFIATFIGYIVLLNSTYFQEKLYSPVILTLFFALLSLIVGHTFMSVYGVSADAIIHCYAMDDELHPDGAKHAPHHLQSLVNKSAQQKLLSNQAS